MSVEAKTRPGWYRNTGPTVLVIQPPVGPTVELWPSLLSYGPDGELLDEPPTPAQAAWLLDDLHHPHLAYAGSDPAGPDSGTEG